VYARLEYFFGRGFWGNLDFYGRLYKRPVVRSEDTFSWYRRSVNYQIGVGLSQQGFSRLRPLLSGPATPGGASPYCMIYPSSSGSDRWMRYFENSCSSSLHSSLTKYSNTIPSKSCQRTEGLCKNCLLKQLVGITAIHIFS